MAAGTLARDAGDYREHPITQGLRDHFSCVWVNRLSATAPAPIVVVPDGAIDLQWITNHWRIAGPDKQPQTELLPAGTVVVGFRFQPGAAAEWLRVAASELCNRRIPLRDIAGSFGARIEAAAAAGEGGSTIAGLEAVLSQWAASMSPPDPAMREAHRMLSRGAPPGEQVVPWLMTTLSMSERTLRRRFQSAFGYGPKTLDRILRFQRYLEITRRDAGPSAARRAMVAGYADQAHLVRECRRLALCTPGNIRSQPIESSP